MIQLYDVNHNKIAGLTNYKDIKRERELSGLETLSFSYPQSDSKCSLIKNEGFVRIKENEYVIKEVNPKTDWTEIVARVNTDDLYGKQFDNFDIEDNLQNVANLALVGTGWTASTDITKKRHISLKCKNAVDIITEMIDIWNCDIWYDAINKVVHFYNSMGSDKGAYFMDRLNLSELEVQGSSYDFITRLIPLGAKDLDITTVNGGSNYIDNHEYSSKVITGYWRTKQYTDPQALKEDAAIRLAKYSKPVIAYNAKVIDLATCSPDKYGILDYSLGDTITLIDEEKGINTKVKIVKTTEYLLEPEKNEVEIASRKQILQDLQISLMDAADSVDAVTNGDGDSIDGSTIDSVDTSQLTGVEDLKLTSAQITDLSANYASIKDLSAATARIGTLETTSATITQLNTANANIENLKTEKADIESLNAANANISTLNTNVASISTLLAGNIGAKNLAVGAIQAGSAVIGEAAISSAQINSVKVGQLEAGDISTTKFRITSDSGNMLMSDNTIQIKDSKQTRVQIGKDASNDYNMYVWDASGNLMFDAAGLKSSGIKDKIIRDDMVSDTANIDAKKINIDSLFTQINGSTNTLKSSKIYLDTQKQTLDLAFSSLSTTVTNQGSTISNQTTAITAMQGQIATKVSQIDITTAVDNVQVGGRNLVLNSDWNVDTTNWTLQTGCTLDTTVQCSNKNSIKMLATGNTSEKDMCLFSSNSILCNPGDIFTASIKLYTDDITTLDSNKVMLEVNFLDSNGSVINWSGASNLCPTSNGIWQPFSYTSIVAPSNAVSVRMAIFLAMNGRVWVSQPKLERGNKATDWTSAPEDIQNQIDVNTNTIGSLSTSLTQTAKSFVVQISNLQTTTSGHDATLNDITTNISFDTDGITLGKSGNPLQLTISNSDINFLQSGNKVAYINGQKMYINSLQVLSDMIIGVHKIEKYDANTTFIRWVG